MASNLDLSSIHAALPDSGTLPPANQPSRSVTSHPHGNTLQGDESDTEMEVNVLDPQEWVPDHASLNYIKNLTRKSRGHPNARKVRVTNTWVQAKARNLLNHTRDRLLAGHAVEDAFPDYDISKDDDGCLHVSKFAQGSVLAIQKCLRYHIESLRTKPASKQAFPDGRVSPARLRDFDANRFDPHNPDLGSTANACCPDLNGAPCNTWNLTFLDSVSKDFVSKVAAGFHVGYDLPPEANDEVSVKRRVKTHLRLMIKKHHTLKRLASAEQISTAKRVQKYMQRRRVKHENRMRTCDQSSKYRKFFSLLKVVGPEGDSDEETDQESQVVPRPIRVFPLRWRSRAYGRLLHNLDAEAKRIDTLPLLHGGPMRTSRRTIKASRICVQAPDASQKLLPISCPAGKPSQFYDTGFVREARTAGILPSLRIGTAYPHKLPRA